MIKYVDDYIDKIQHKWPDIPREELKYIVEHGFRRLTDVLLNGGKVIIDQGVKIHIEPPTPCEFRKHEFGRAKFRYEYKFLGKKWDGYYYFSCTKEQWERNQKRIKNNRKLIFENLFLYKIKDETYLSMSHDYFFRTPYLEDVGFRFYRKKFSPKKIEMIAYRDEHKHIIELNGEQYSKSDQECTG